MSGVPIMGAGDERPARLDKQCCPYYIWSGDGKPPSASSTIDAQTLPLKKLVQLQPCRDLVRILLETFHRVLI